MKKYKNKEKEIYAIEVEEVKQLDNQTNKEDIDKKKYNYLHFCQDQERIIDRDENTPASLPVEIPEWCLYKNREVNSFCDGCTQFKTYSQKYIEDNM